MATNRTLQQSLLLATGWVRVMVIAPDRERVYPQVSGFNKCATLSRDLLTHLVGLKQATDLHSKRVSRWLVLQQLRDPARNERVAQLVEHCRRRSDSFCASLNARFSDLTTREVPAGVYFSGSC
jgi:hypothetical protein